MLNRRRFLSIAATGAVMGSMPARLALAATEAPAPTVWKGVAMGAQASMTLVHPDRALARSMIKRCVAEVERLESIFSLYRPDSALSRLNAEGRLDRPPSELAELLSFGLSLAQRSQGAFDPTVQPLLRLYFDHFSRPGAAPDGPPAEAIARARERVGFTDVEVGLERIRLGRPGAAITLNGVAQGFVTDRVAELLQANGFGNVLIDLGEGRALGHRPDGAPWRAAIAHPFEPDRTLFELPLGSASGQRPALATSAGYGTRFGPTRGSITCWIRVPATAPTITRRFRSQPRGPRWPTGCRRRFQWLHRSCAARCSRSIRPRGHGSLIGMAA